MSPALEPFTDLYMHAIGEHTPSNWGECTKECLLLLCSVNLQPRSLVGANEVEVCVRRLVTKNAAMFSPLALSNRIMPSS